MFNIKKSSVIAIALMMAVICQACGSRTEAETSGEISGETSSSVSSSQITETSAETSYAAIDHEKYAKEFIGYLTDFGTAVLGYNIKVTQCAYYLYSLTADNRIDQTDPAAVKNALIAEYSKLDPEMKEVMKANYNESAALINECNLDDSVIRCFSDLDKEEEMRKLIHDAAAHNSWIALKEIMSEVVRQI